jgi:hypothetical protein
MLVPGSSRVELAWPTASSTGSTRSRVTTANWSFAGEILSSIHINGVSKYYGSADCVIYGFKYTVPMQIDPGFDDMLFVVTPAVKKRAPSAALAEARTNYWSRLRANAAS